MSSNSSIFVLISNNLVIDGEKGVRPPVHMIDKGPFSAFNQLIETNFFMMPQTGTSGRRTAGQKIKLLNCIQKNEANEDFS